MSFFGRTHARIGLLLFVASCLVFVRFPGIDLAVSARFHREGGFHLKQSWWTTALHQSVAVLLVAALAAVVGVWLYNRRGGRVLYGIDGRTVCYLVLVLILGAGLIVNVLFKDFFGRARPRNVPQFGGVQEFSPAFVLSSSCQSNCSFASGDSSGAFFLVVVALAIGRRRAPVAIAAGYAVLVSFARIAEGAHFLSDTVVSGFVIWITAAVLRHFMFPREPAPAAAELRPLPRSGEWRTGREAFSAEAEPVESDRAAG